REHAADVLPHGLVGELRGDLRRLLAVDATLAAVARAAIDGHPAASGSPGANHPPAARRAADEAGTEQVRLGVALIARGALRILAEARLHGVERGLVDEGRAGDHHTLVDGAHGLLGLAVALPAEGLVAAVIGRVPENLAQRGNRPVRDLAARRGDAF